MGVGERFGRELDVDAFELEHHAARLDDGDESLVATLTFTHSDLGRLLGNRLVGEDADVEFAGLLDRTSDGDASRLDLARAVMKPGAVA